MAARIPERVIQDIKDRVSIREVVEDYVRLVKDGANYKGLCPFHQEKTPSFKVHEAKGIFKCFGCGESGNVFSFLMKVEGMTFVEAAEKLAARAGVSIPRHEEGPEDKQRRRKREALFEANLAAAKFFHQTLLSSPEAGGAREYLEARGITKESIEKYMLGFSPGGWRTTLEKLSAKGVSREDMLAAGLIIKKEDKNDCYDRFRGRLMFPIRDVQGNVRGFGARQLSDDPDQPKYVNTPETPVFKKGEGFFGIHEAKSGIRKQGRAVIVEGYTDQIILDQHGINYALATLGTALTEEHARLVVRYAPEVFLVFDSDEAGQKASLRSLPAFLEAGLSPRIVKMPGAADPDEFIRSRGAEEFLELMDASPPLLSFFCDAVVNSAGDTPSALARAVGEAAQMISRVKDPIERSVFVERLSKKAGVPVDKVEMKLRRPEKRREGRPAPGPEADYPPAQMDLVRLLVHHPETAERIRSSGVLERLGRDELSGFIRSLIAHESETGRIDPGSLLHQIEDQMIVGWITSMSLGKDPFDGIVDKALNDVILKLEQGDIEDRLSRLQAKIMDAQERGEELLWRRLLEEQQALLQQKQTLSAGES